MSCQGCLKWEVGVGRLVCGDAKTNVTKRLYLGKIEEVYLYQARAEKTNFPESIALLKNVKMASGWSFHVLWSPPGKIKFPLGGRGNITIKPLLQALSILKVFPAVTLVCKLLHSPPL